MYAGAALLKRGLDGVAQCAALLLRKTERSAGGSERAAGCFLRCGSPDVQARRRRAMRNPPLAMSAKVPGVGTAVQTRMSRPLKEPGSANVRFV